MAYSIDLLLERIDPDLIVLFVAYTGKQVFPNSSNRVGRDDVTTGKSSFGAR